MNKMTFKSSLRKFYHIPIQNATVYDTKIYQIKANEILKPLLCNIYIKCRG